MSKKSFAKLGKRILVTLLTVSMLCNSVTVSATTVSDGDAVATVQTETTVSDGDSVTNESTEPSVSGGDSGTGESTEPSVSGGDSGTGESTEPTVSDGDITGVTSPEDFVVGLEGTNLVYDETTRVFTGGISNMTVYFYTQAAYETLEISISNSDGSEVDFVYNSGNAGEYQYYNGSYSAIGEFNGETVNVTVDGTTYSYSIVPDWFYSEADGVKQKLRFYTRDYLVGDIVTLSAEITRDGVIGYFTVPTDLGYLSYVDNMPEAAATEWTENYAATYGEYGASDKYYCFTYGDDNIWWPSFEGKSVGYTQVDYAYYKSETAEFVNAPSCGWVSITPDYRMTYEGETLVTNENSQINLVPYDEGDLVFALMDGDTPLTAEAATVTIASTGYYLENALSIETDAQTGAYSVKIAADKILDWNDNTISLADWGDNSLWFRLSIQNTTTGSSYDKSYEFVASGIAMIRNGVSEHCYDYIDSGETYLYQTDAAVGFTIPELRNRIDDVTGLTITSSNSEVIALHGTIQKVMVSETSWNYRECQMEPLKVGESTITVKYTLDGEEQTKSFKVKVGVDGEDFGFGYFDDDNNFIPFEDGQEITLPTSETIFIYTNVAAYLTSDITVTSGNNNLLQVYSDNITAEYIYQEEYGNAYFNRRDKGVGTSSINTGTTTLTMSAEYNGETYTQTVTVNVVEPGGLQARYAYLYAPQYGYSVSSRCDNIYIGKNWNLTQMKLVCTDSQGDYELVNVSDYNFEILKYDSSAQDYVASTDFTVEFIDSEVFYVLPDLNTLTKYTSDYILRISPKDEASELEGIEIEMIFSVSDTGLYLSYSDEEGLSKPVNNIYLEEGKDFEAYFWSYKSAGTEFGFNNTTDAERYGYSLKTEWVAETDNTNIYKAIISYDGTATTSSSRYNAIVTPDYWMAEFYIYLLPEADKYVPAATQHQISDFLNADASGCDLEGVRISDYEVSLKTGADGSKYAIITGYLGNANGYPRLPQGFVVDAIVEADTDVAHAMSVDRLITVIGCADGIFDVEEGYRQPAGVYVPESYTYFGENYTGWTNPDSGIRTIYRRYYYELNEFGNPSIRWYDAQPYGLLVVSTENGYVCVDTGNQPVGAVVDGEAVLYSERTEGGTILNLIKADKADGYTLNSAWMTDENGTEIPVAVSMTDGNAMLNYSSTHASGLEFADLQSGTYYMKLIPYVEYGEGVINLAEQTVPVELVFADDAPEVNAQDKITINTYFGSDAVVPLELDNSYDTAVTSVTLKEAKAGLSVRQSEDGTWLLCWDGKTTIPKNTKITLEYVIAGYDAEAGEEIPSQTITVNGVKTQPVASCDVKSITFDEYPFEQSSVMLSVAKNDYRNNIIVEASDVKVTSAPKGAVASVISATFEQTGIDCGELTVNVSNNAISGTYKLQITPRVGSGQVAAKPVTLTVVVKSEKPEIEFVETANVTLNNNFYNTYVNLPELNYADEDSMNISAGIVKLGDVQPHATIKTMPKNATAESVTLNTEYYDWAEPWTVQDSDGNVYEAYDPWALVFYAGVKEDAPVGNYVFDIELPTIVGGEVIWMTTTATVKVVNTLPTAKLTSSSVTLDASYVGSQVNTQLVMNEGYTLAGLDVAAPSVNAEECINVSYSGDGQIYFNLMQAGLSKAGTYKVTPVLAGVNGEQVTLKQMKITVKVTNSSKVTLSAKSKALTLNPYEGIGVAKAELQSKGFTETEGVTYTTEYLFVPTNELAKEARENGKLWLSVDSGYGQIIAETPAELANGNYTFNLVEVICGSDNTVVYTKPLAFTVKVALKKLTVVPETGSITLYKDYCSKVTVDNKEYYEVSVPVSIKEYVTWSAFGTIDTSAEATNSMQEQGVKTQFVFNEDTWRNELVITFPADMSNLKNLKVTPVADNGTKSFNDVKISVAVKESVPVVQFAEKSVSLNRWVDAAATNTLSIPGYDLNNITGISVVVKKGTTEYNFMPNLDAATGSFTVQPVGTSEMLAELPNGKYTVTVNISGKDNQGNAIAFESGSFTLNMEQPNVDIVLGDDEVSAMNINLYPDDYKTFTDTIVVKAYSGRNQLAISKVVANLIESNQVTTAKTDTLEVDGATEQVVQIVAKDDDAGDYTYGKNTYNLDVYVNDANGTEVLAGTLKKAFAVNVKGLPETIKLTESKLTFQPYLEDSAAVYVDSAELEELIGLGYYSYNISVKETDSDYAALAESEKNNLLSVTADESGKIEVTAAKYPEENVTYYYQATVNLKHSDLDEPSATYTAKFSVEVKKTVPTAALQNKAVTLNDTYLGHMGNTTLVMSTGGTRWSLDAENMPTVVVKNSKNADITGEGYFNVNYGTSQDDNGTYFDGNIYVSLNERNEAGELISVPKGNYKLEITPKAETVNGDKLDLAPVTLTVKVVSNKPTAKYQTTKLSVNTYSNEGKNTPVTLSNGGGILGEDSLVECTKVARGGNAEAVHVMFADDGQIWAYADRNAVAGTYNFRITPATNVNGYVVRLAPKSITVVVTDSKPTAVLSSKTVTLNTLFGDYSAEIFVSAKNAGWYGYTFDKSAIVTTETNASKNAEAAKLLEQMNVELLESGEALIRLSLPDAAGVKPGNYKFKLTPKLWSGASTDEYTLKDVTFTVKVENKKPTMSAKVMGTFNVLDPECGVSCQVSMSKQPYESPMTFQEVTLLDSKTGRVSGDFSIDGEASDWENGIFIIKGYYGGYKAGTSYSLKLQATSQSGQVYTANIKIKAVQPSYKITADTASFYTLINSGKVELQFNAFRTVQGVELTKVTTDAAGKKTITGAKECFNIMVNDGETIEFWTTKDLLENTTIEKGDTVYFTFDVYPQGLATNKSATKVVVPVVIK